MSRSPTAELADYAAGLRLEDVPQPVAEHLKLCLLDTFGCALFGADLPWSVILTSTLRSVDRADDAPVWGTSHRLSTVHAALANGAMAHAFELDDLHKDSILHPGSVVLPAVMAVAGLRPDAGGAEAMAAVLAGYEVGARVGMSVGSAHLLQGWHPTGTHGALAAAAGAARMLGLSSGETRDALGIAGSQAGGLMASQFGSMVKRFHAGRAAQSGVYAALLARNGYVGISNLFESSYGGYCSTFSPSYDLDALTAGLGEVWETLRVGFKPYSTNGSCHPSIDLLRDLLARHAFGPDDVADVEIRSSSATVAHVGWTYVPDSVTTAQMNLPYITAVVLADGDAFVEQFSEERIRDPDLVQLASRVRVTADPEIDAQGTSARHNTHISIRLRDGRVVSGARQSARGSAADPLTSADVRGKFRRLVGGAIGLDRASRLEAIVDELDGLPDLALLHQALVADEGGSRDGEGR